MLEVVCLLCFDCLIMCVSGWVGGRERGFWVFEVQP
jgi:hypothetical protein